jgi:hypothetical protein
MAWKQRFNQAVTRLSQIQDEAIKAVRGLSFWCIILALCVTAILSALPTIVQDFRGAELYIWSVNGYLFAR